MRKQPWKIIGPINALYLSLTVTVGALVQGKPNFITIAHVGIMNHGTPQYISMGMGKVHYTNQGIKENQQLYPERPEIGLLFHLL